MRTEDLTSLIDDLYEHPDDDASWLVLADHIEQSGAPGYDIVRSNVAGRSTYLSFDATAPYLGALSQFSPRLGWAAKPRFAFPIEILPRGPVIELTLDDKGKQKRAAEILTRTFDGMPLLRFGVRLTLFNPLEPALAEALRGLPLLTLALNPIPSGGPAYSLADLPLVRALSLRGAEMTAKRPKDRAPLVDTLLLDGRFMRLMTLLPDLPLRRLKAQVHTQGDVERVARCEGLCALDLHLRGGAKRLDLSPLRALPLQHLALSEGVDGDMLAPIGDIPTIQTLSVSYADTRFDTRPLARLQQLRTLIFESCAGSLDLAPVVALPELRFVRTHQCPDLEGWHDLGKARPEIDLDWYIDTRE